ncbi:MAG TPA: YdcF family protein [Pyrinomonadaceae bacterium]|nr:YdcF family protein [Pyrinomonadaceae bacterium]
MLSWKKTRHRRVLLILVAGILLWETLAWIGARALIVRSDLPHADAMVILSGSSSYRERTQVAAQLFAAGRAPKIILTNDDRQGGWSNVEQRNPRFSELALASLVSSGVSIDKIVLLPDRVQSTHDEAVLLRRYAEVTSLKSLLIVTSPSHSRRALWTFRKEFQGTNITLGLSFGDDQQGDPSPFLWWTTIKGWRLVAGEYLKFVYYLFRYSAG